MRILQIHTRYREAGGEDGVQVREAELLRARGHDVETLTFANPSSAPGAALAMAGAPWNPNSARKSGRVAERFDPDVVHVHNTWFRATPSAVRAARKSAPTVATIHNYRLLCANGLLYRDGGTCLDCVGRSLLPGVQHRCYRDSAASSVVIAGTTELHRRLSLWPRSVDRFLVLSDFSADLLTRVGIPPDQITRHDNFVGDPGPRTRPADEASTVLLIGRLSPEKGFDLVLEAWADGAPADVELVVIGDGSERARLERLAGPKVRFLGRLDSNEIQRQMLEARALLVPSRCFEGQPLVILEALAAGLPVMASAQPPLVEVLMPAGQRAVEPSSAGWQEALRSLDDATWLSEASRRGRSRFESAFHPDVAAKRLTAIYEDVHR